MKREKNSKPNQGSPIYAHLLYDPAVCTDGGNHQWDGEPIELGWGSSATCSKCGRDAMSVDAFIAP